MKEAVREAIRSILAGKAEELDVDAMFNRGPNPERDRQLQMIADLLDIFY